VKLLQGKMGNAMDHIGVDNNFMNNTVIAQQIGLHETKKLLPSKRNGHRLKRQPTEW
jgi:hypothetical protein